MADRNDSAVRGVLVTRPLGDAADTLCAAVEAAGYKAHSQPLIELNGLPELPPALRHMVLDLDQYQHIIFISANAVRFGMEAVTDHWPQLPVGINWYAVGAATARGLEEFGIHAVTPGSDMTSEGLLALPYLRNVEGQRVLIIKGEGGRHALRTELLHRGALVDELACYRRALPNLPEGSLAQRLEQWEIDVILLSSGEGLANLLLLLSPAETTKLKAVGLIVPSGRVAQMAREAGFDQVVTAENASDAEMLRALQQWRPSCGE
ncbi:Uroporphyrinogen-III synthase [Halioglobus japonicus]|nr:Uroporphyrinogen-III synthase [Halioglobus japonicus]